MKTEKLIATALLTTMLAACGGDEQTATFNWKTAELAYSYPYQGQYEVPLAAPLVLHFSEPVQANESELLDRVELFRLDDEGETKITLEVASLHEADAPHPVSVVLRPATGKLDPATSYRVDLGELSTDLSELGVPPGGISFRTRGDRDSARSRMGDDTFFVSRMVPDGSDLEVLDFSTLRVQFSQPVDRDSLRYGETLALLDEDDALVDARIYLKGHYLTVAPKEELEPGREYRLVQQGEGLRSVGGDTLELFNGTPLAGFAPENTRPRAAMVQKARSSLADDSLVSRLTGALINAVPVTAVLLGEPEDNTSFQQGNVFAELGHVPSFPEAVPLRVPRGNQLKGSSLEVKVAGEVPAGFGTGDISVTFINDSVGYMIPNDFNANRANKNMPRHVRLMMDIAMTAENPEANAALSQDLMHVELAGIAMVRDGVMEIDAVGVVEPEVLGLETASGLLSFNMVAYEDQKNAPEMEADLGYPRLQSWLPGEEHQDSARRGDPIILNFTKPLDPESIRQQGAVTVERSDMPLDFQKHLDGASLVIYPEGGLQHGSEYTVKVTSMVTDTAGNPVEDDYSLEIALPEKLPTDGAEEGDGLGRSPIVIGTSPGFPCATEGAQPEAAFPHHGRCEGSVGTDAVGNPVENLPVTSLASNRPIEVQFSQEMDPASFGFGEQEYQSSVWVERQGPETGQWERVNGRLDVRPRLMRFWPDEPWEPGVLYRYVLGSNDNSFSRSAECDGTQSLCSEQGLPLQTRVLAEELEQAPEPDGGGPDMQIFFHGTESGSEVFQPLRNIPTADVNADFVLQQQEIDQKLSDLDPEVFTRAPRNSTELRIGEVGGNVASASIGCNERDDESCEDNKFIHITGGLNADVIGYDPDEDAVEVHIRPTLIMTTSIDVYTRLGLGGNIGIINEVLPTGPQVMRLRYAQDDDGNRNQPIQGWIRDGENGPVFETELDLFLDAPWLNPKALGTQLEHNQRAYPLDGVTVEGPVTFLEDGRMLIEQRNTGPLSIDVEAEGTIWIIIPIPVSAEMELEIPIGGIHLLYTSMPVKE